VGLKGLGILGPHPSKLFRLVDWLVKKPIPTLGKFITQKNPIIRPSTRKGGSNFKFLRKPRKVA